MTTNPRHLGALIRVSREQRDWTQVELGRRVGATQLTIGNWESGKHVPRPGKLAELERVLGVDLSPAAAASHAAIEAVRVRLAQRMRDLGAVEAAELGADSLAAVEEWQPQNAPKPPQPGG